jgi:pyridoxal 5'-phosphate synthase pdxS subunit
MMQLGAEIIFVGSGIFMKEGAIPLDVEPWSKGDAEVGLCTTKDVGQPRNPADRAEAVSRARAIVLATLHFDDPKIVSEASEAVIGSMKGLAAAAIEEKDLMQTRGW